MGLHNEIEYSFMVVGHTKFSCDRCFGALKKKTSVTALWTLYDIAKCCDDSAICNTSKLVGTHTGDVLVPTYDWVAMLSKYFYKVPNITDFHHFRIKSSDPGTVHCLRRLDSPPTILNLFKKNTKFVKEMPEIIQPHGFTAARKKYLYQEIRHFCAEGTEDVVAPVPI